RFEKGILRWTLSMTGRKPSAALMLAALALAVAVWQWRAIGSEALVNLGTVRRLAAEVGGSSPTVNLASAESAYARALDLNPSSWVAGQALGRTELELGRPGEAAKQLRAALAGGLPSPGARFELGSAELELGGWCRTRSLAENNAEAAGVGLLKSRSTPGFSGSYGRQWVSGQTAMPVRPGGGGICPGNRVDTAAEQGNRAAYGFDPIVRGDVEAAVGSWRQAGAAPLLVRQAGALADEGAGALAERWYRLALEVDSTEPLAFEGLAELYAARGDWPAGQAVLEREIAVRPKRAAPYAMLGMLAYWRGGSLPAAERWLRQAIALDSRNEAVKRALADIFADAGMASSAQAQLGDADRTLRATGRPSPTLGRMYEMLGMDRRAEGEFIRVAYGQPSDPIGNYLLGRLSLKEGNQADGIRELRAAVRAIPNQEEFRLALARAYARGGEVEAAKREYAVVLALDPGSAEARAVV
ncbi:MAG: tetratricopeptide repeat protein, partial [Chloroflexota bacterium]|nr:tetratricopeptide repeat protein [Chloroflexota bacterium]